MDADTLHKAVQDYYGKEIQSVSELKTQACCTTENQKLPTKVRNLLKEISDEVTEKYYGCGLTIPTELEGAHVLDLGSGAGRDCFLLSGLVGAKGRVVGVDMTPEQLDVANRNIEYHRKKFGYLKTNVEFHKGLLEKLEDIPALQDNSFDVIVSNCVINLVQDKAAVLKHVYRLLKPGGEFYFSDVYADRRVPEKLQKDPILWGECISGALYTRDFISLAKRAGFADPRLVSTSPIALGNPTIEKLVAPIKFYSSVYRLFKISEFDLTGCEDYGQAVVYRGTMENDPAAFTLDIGHVFEAGKFTRVCRNTCLMLKATRFSQHFQFFGDDSTHLGPYEECGTGNVASSSADCCSGDSCCAPVSKSTSESCCSPSTTNTANLSGCCIDKPLETLPEINASCCDGDCGACDMPSKPVAKEAPQTTPAASSCCSENKCC